MNRNDLIDAIAGAAEISKSSADKALDAVIDAITNALTAGDAVQFGYLGKFSVSKREARVGRNPKTGESINIPAKIIPKFSAGKKLKEAVAK
jgi:nucleoid DNA-binding protein